MKRNALNIDTILSLNGLFSSLFLTDPIRSPLSSLSLVSRTCRSVFFCVSNVKTVLHTKMKAIDIFKQRNLSSSCFPKRVVRSYGLCSFLFSLRFTRPCTTRFQLIWTSVGTSCFLLRRSSLPYLSMPMYTPTQMDVVMRVI